MLVHEVVERQHLSEDAKSHLKLDDPELTLVEDCQLTKRLYQGDHNPHNIAHCEKEHNLEHIALFIGKGLRGIISLNFIQLLDQQKQTDQEGCSNQNHLRKVNDHVSDWLKYVFYWEA